MKVIRVLKILIGNLYDLVFDLLCAYGDQEYNYVKLDLICSLYGVRLSSV